jgi:cytochrome b pre-mRNA-processing protein 3
LNGEAIDNARRLAVYAEAAIAALSALDDATLQGASWKFPMPVEQDSQP